MERLRLLTGCSLAIALAALIGACDDGPTRPSSRSSPDIPVNTRGLEIMGPNTVAPGESVQFAATALQTDGSTRNVTNEVVWQSAYPHVLSISATGLGTGRERGGTRITAALGGLTAVKNEVLVLPNGTFRLVGAVRDAGVSLSGARVEVIAGTGQGLATIANGHYVLFGVAGDIEVRATRDGYQEQRQRVRVTSHHQLDFDMVLSRPRDEVAGTYTLTVTAAAECRENLPEEARSRRYTAVLGQEGPRLTATLERGTFASVGGATRNSFRGTVEPGRVTFHLNEYFSDAFYLYYPDVLEQLSAQTFLAVSGAFVGTVSPAGVAGTLNGPIETMQPGSFQRIATCRSAGHQFVLSR
jgi:hypothetical protein